MSARSAQGLGDSSRILLLPVELDETAEATVAFTKAHILRPGDVVLFLHVVPSYTEQFQPALGFGGEAVITAVRDVEFEQARREAAENFVTIKLHLFLPLASPLLTPSQVASRTSCWDPQAAISRTTAKSQYLFCAERVRQQCFGPRATMP